MWTSVLVLNKSRLLVLVVLSACWYCSLLFAFITSKKYHSNQCHSTTKWSLDRNEPHIGSITVCNLKLHSICDISMLNREYKILLLICNHGVNYIFFSVFVTGLKYYNLHIYYNYNAWIRRYNPVVTFLVIKLYKICACWYFKN